MLMRLSSIALVLCTAALAACGSSAASSTAGAGTAAPATATATTAQAPCPSAGSTASVPGAPLQTILRVPAANRTRRAPLLVALHFASGTGGAMEQRTGLTAEARRAGFDVAYPTATSANGFWQASDLPQLQQTITAIEKAACIDRHRVYLLGWSNGGGMAALAACRIPDTI